MLSQRAREGCPHSRQTIAAIFVDETKRRMYDDQLPCALLTRESLDALLGDSSENNILDIRRRHANVLRICAVFLMKPRDKNSRRRLARAGWPETKGQCGCDLSSPFVREMHDNSGPLALKGGESHLQLILQKMLRVFDLALQRSPDLKRLLRAWNGDSDQIWPAGPRDLAPFGIVESFTALCEWTEYHLPGFYISGVVIRLYRPFTYESFPCLLVGTILPKAFTPVLYALVCQLRPSNNTARRISLASEGLALTCRALISVLPQRAEISKALKHTDTSFVPFVDACLQALDAIRTLSFPDSEGCMRILMAYAGLFHDVCGLPADPARYPLHAFQALHDSRPSPWFIVGKLFERLAYPYVCGRMGCTKSALEEGRIFRRCAGCRLVGYCSRACQKRAWKDKGPSVPHRDECERIKMVVECSGFGEGAEDFGENCVAHGLQLDLADTVSRHLLVLYTQ